jgi:ADP-dependent NAD(P)H-hydrate dehydratase / NAD(P)H-hydrate epimerase
MSRLIIGTAPYEDFPLIEGVCEYHNGDLSVGGHRIHVARGTPALIATAALAAELLGIEPPNALIAGDIGKGTGSAKVYQRLLDTLPDRSETLLVFHYIQPDLDWHNRVFLKLEELPETPLLIADAGYMYVAKMSGLAPSYDLFTPDIGELAFLADESAPHPFYTRGYLLQDEGKAEELIKRAYECENAARHLLVKGKSDRVASKKGILATISEPCVENMEPIGGTGDTLTGLITVLANDRPIPEAATIAAKANRLMGLYANPTPACSVSDLVAFLHKALESALTGKSF